MSNWTYSEVYKYRLNRHGSTHKDREYSYGLENFQKYLAQHPSSVTVFIDGLQTQASIISNKQDEFSLTKEILVRVDTNIHPGSIVTWDQEHWIVYQRVRQPNETYITCYMIRCNNKITWLDEYGAQQYQFCHVLSSQDSKIKGNFRTWNGLITPQPNQYLEMLVPSNDSIKLGQKFIIDQRAWFVVEYDKTSAPGITYYSLTQDKVDRQDDDVDNGLADYKDKNKVRIELDDIAIMQGNSIFIRPIVYKDNAMIQQGVGFYIADNDIAEIQYNGTDAMIVGKALGQTKLHAFLIKSPKIHTIVNIDISEIEQPTKYQFEGTESLKISQTGIYTIYSLGAIKTIEPIISCTLSNDLATATLLEDGTVMVKANEKNKLGMVTLTVATEYDTFTKTITIRSLW